MPETTPSDDIIDLTDIVEEDGSPTADPGSAGAGVDMSFERELEDLFSDAEPAPATARSTPPPAAPEHDDALEPEDMDLSGIGLDGGPTTPSAESSPVADAEDGEAIDLSDFLEVGPGAQPRSEEALEAPAPVRTGDADADAVDVRDLEGLDEFAEEDADLELPASRAAKDDDALPDLSGLGLDEDDAFADFSDQAEKPVPPVSEFSPAAAVVAPAAEAPVAPVVAAAEPEPAGDIDLDALDMIIAKAGGPPPVPTEEEAQAAAAALDAAVARLSAVEERLSGLADQAGRHEDSLTALAAVPAAAPAAPVDTGALRTEFSALLEERLAVFGQELAEAAPTPVDVTPALSAQAAELKAFVEERLEAFGQELAEAAPTPVDVTPALSAQATELKAFVEERLEAVDQDVASRLASLPDPAARTDEAVAGVWDEITALRAEVAALKADLEARTAQAATALDAVAAARAEVSELSAVVAGLRGEVACRVTKVDQDALVTRLRMDLAAEIQKRAQELVPAEAARIIREEIAALAGELDD